MKCLRKYEWVKLPRDYPDMGKGLMASWARLASRAAFRKGNARYCGHTNPVTPGMWSGGVVGLKSILGAKSRPKALQTLDELANLGFLKYTLDKKMPIYLGATYQHMADGAALLSQTSIPMGGTNTNAVIAGHRGWGGASYFRYIDQLQPGDEVIITNLWEELHYEVSEIQIIQPNEVEKILIQPGRELITLLTCHPYASGGRQRYLVICERIPYEPDTE